MATQEVDVVAGNFVASNLSGHLSLGPGTVVAGIPSAGSGSSSPGDSFEVPRDQHMQTVFDRTVCTELALPYQYQVVNVLIVRWAQYLDQDSKCSEEVSELKKIFSEGFNFNTEVLELNDKRRPQLQLDTGIKQFILDHDGPCRSHLMIVYYTGHGIGHEEGLHISGVRESGVSAIGEKHVPVASWSKAEQSLLHDADADVLMIMDTCNAGNLIKAGSEDIRSFEVLTAAPKDTPTAAAGPRSFSEAMIKALKEQLARDDQFPFTAFDLNAKIIQKRHKQHSQVHPRLNKHSHRHIKIAPLKHQPTAMSSPAPAKPEASHLTIRLAFEKRTEFKEHEAETLAKELSKAASRSELGISRIEWVKHTRPTSIWDTYMLYKAVKKAQRLWRKQLSNARLKRKRDDNDDGGEDLVCKRAHGLPMTPNSGAGE